MQEDLRMESLWRKLKVAVNTYGERLPVDAFLPDPESRVAERPRPRTARDCRAEPVEDLSISESIPGDAADTKPSRPPKPEPEPPSLEEDLRMRLLGNDFADPEDL